MEFTGHRVFRALEAVSRKLKQQYCRYKEITGKPSPIIADKDDFVRIRI
jgi:hypothetical protein